MSKYVNETDAAKQQAMKDEVVDKWLAYLFLNGSNSAKYGPLNKSFQQQFSLNNNQYPKDLTAATNALSNHSFDQQFYDNRDKQQRSNQQSQQQTGNNNNSNDIDETSFAQRERRCYVCGDPGHLQPDCSQKIPSPIMTGMLTELCKIYKMISTTMLMKMMMRIIV